MSDFRVGKERSRHEMVCNVHLIGLVLQEDADRGQAK